jgi:hypothetical protein
MNTQMNSMRNYVLLSGTVFEDEDLDTISI